MDRERRRLCRCKRAAMKDLLSVTRTGAHGAERRAINFLKFRRRFFTQQIRDCTVYVGHGKCCFRRTTDWKSSDTKGESTGPRSRGHVVQLLLQYGIGGVWIDSHFECDLSFFV